MSVSEIDRQLLESCLERKPRAWKDFVDRFLGLVVHVINHTAQSRSVYLTSHDRDDLAAEVFLAMIKDNLAVLRRFRGKSSLATYLTLVARRIVVRELLQRKTPTTLGENMIAEDRGDNSDFEQRIGDRDEVERLIKGLKKSEATVVRLYHLEGKSYREISDKVGIPENSVGPTLSRARGKMRQSTTGGRQQGKTEKRREQNTG